MTNFDKPSREEIAEMAEFLKTAEIALYLKTGEICNTSTVIDYLTAIDCELLVGGSECGYK